MTSTLTELARTRSAALRIVAGLVALSTTVAFGESYRALYLWAAHHDVPSGWAFTWPAMVDVFVAVGELSLFIGMTDRWPARHRAWAWTVTAGGLAVSVAGNVGHVGSAQWTDRLTAAVPPVAAFVALTVGLGILKRVVELAQAAPAAEPGPGPDLTDIRHRAVLDNAESDAQRVRYAVRQTGRTEIAPVSEWLAARGHSIPDSNLMSVMRRESTRDLTRVNGHQGPETRLV